MKRLIITVAIAFIALLQVNAQSSIDVVYLKNGSIIRGVLLEQIPNQSIKLQTSDGSIFVYSMDEVERITKDQNQRAKSNAVPVAFNFDEYKWFVDAGFLIGIGDLKEERIEISTTHGYQLNHILFAGAGIGLHYLTISEIFMLPIYVNARAYLTDHVYRPYVDLRLGYSPMLSNEGIKVEDINIKMKGGVYFAPTVGVHFQVPNSNYSMNVGLGFDFQRLGTKANIAGIKLSENESLNAFAIRVGVEF